MKSIIQILLLLLIVIDPVFSQNDFKVIKVNGTILLKSKGISLETGTVFSQKDDLLFRSEDATAAVINSQRGRMVITSRNHDLTTAGSNSLPSMYNISSRGVDIVHNTDLSNLFSGKYVIFDRQGIEVDNETYPMDNNHFFFLRYIYKDEGINKKLGFSGDTLFIDKSTLFTVDGHPIPSPDNTKIKLFYRNGDESTFISEFDLVFPDMKQLAKETQIILDAIKGKSTNEKIGEVGSYINDFYGKVPRECLVKWLETRFAIK